MNTPTQSDPVMETYTKPAHGWTCFHCGETFTTFGTARDHFGFDPSCDPACQIKHGAERGLVMALRKAEMDAADAWQAIGNESTEAARAYYAQATRHNAQIMAAEEAGYERGLADGRAHHLKGSDDV
jgi:phage terminase large subunit GpA-like protein